MGSLTPHLGMQPSMRKLRLIGAVLVMASLFTACTRSEAETRSASQRPAVTSTTTTAPAEPVPVAELAPPTPEEAAADDPLLTGGPRPAAPPARAKGRVTPTGHIEIPAIGLSHPTYEGIDLSIINHGPSHWPGTALPGQRGNTVFPGHRTTHSRPFWDIDKLVPGNEVIFTTPQGRFTYRVTRTFVVDDQEYWITRPTDNATFTIFACHPKGSARQRYVAKGELVGTPVGGGTATTTKPKPAPQPTSTTTTTTVDGGLLPGALPG